jgi:4-hydroxy-4-methyl-2-oxoglutarate aldolase
MRVNSDIRRVDPDLVAAYRNVAPATLGHKHNLRFMHSAIKPLFDDIKLVGPAFTVRAPGIDAAALAKVDELAQPGDVVIVDRGGDMQHACVGEFRALKHIRQGLAGWVIDGAATDVLEIRKMRFPVFARAVSALVGKMIGVEGDVGLPIQCGGVVVNPGDLIVADDNGIAVLSEDEAAQLLPAALEVEEREREMREQYAAEYRKLVM